MDVLERYRPKERELFPHLVAFLKGFALMLWIIGVIAWMSRSF